MVFQGICPQPSLLPNLHPDRHFAEEPISINLIQPLTAILNKTIVEIESLSGPITLKIAIALILGDVYDVYYLRGLCIRFTLCGLLAILPCYS